VPTLALLLGLPIPFSSIGKVIPELFLSDMTVPHCTEILRRFPVGNGGESSGKTVGGENGGGLQGEVVTSTVQSELTRSLMKNALQVRAGDLYVQWYRPLNPYATPLYVQSSRRSESLY